MTEFFVDWVPTPQIEAVEAAVREHFADSPRRFEHSIGCAQTAVLMAELYGADKNNAALAGLLHDWDKTLDAKDLRTQAKETSSGLTQAQIESGLFDPILHAVVGAETIKKKYPLMSPEVYSAIAKHTVGDSDMSPLDAIIYIADIIEPTRGIVAGDTKDLSKTTQQQQRYQAFLAGLRESVGVSSLSQLLLAAYRHNIIYLLETSKVLYPHSASIYNALLVGENV